MSYNEFDVLRRTVFTERDSIVNCYILDISCDANDGDYINKTLTLDEDIFEADELFILVLSYVSKYNGKFADLQGSSAFYGHLVRENPDFEWLEEYLIENDILAYAGMCDSRCHSVSDLIITYYDKDGVAYYVLLPDVDELFETREEFVGYMNKLYERYCSESGE